MHGKPLLELELRPINAPACATPGASVYVLLPALDDLLNAPSFGDIDPIMLERPVFNVRFSPSLIPRRFMH